MADLYERITNTILHQIETADPNAWVCPWHRAPGGLPRNALSGRNYRGVNILSLWCGALASGFADDRWATYRQWSELGAQVRKGEQGTPVLFFKDVPRAMDDTGEDGDRRWVARSSVVFNAAQVLGAQPQAHVQATDRDHTPELDKFLAATGAMVREGEGAAYLPSIDEIRMPARERFHSANGYCATLAHELVHWTGAKSRLDRDLSTRFGTRSYAAEELVAELGSAFIMAQLNLASEPHSQHATYMASWLPLLREDARAVFTAASLASRAAEFLQPAEIPTVQEQEASPAPPPAVPLQRRPRVHTWTRGTRIFSHGW